jgi:hypothetical protein
MLLMAQRHFNQVSVLFFFLGGGASNIIVTGVSELQKRVLFMSSLQKLDQKYVCEHTNF